MKKKGQGSTNAQKQELSKQEFQRIADLHQKKEWEQKEIERQKENVECKVKLIEDKLNQFRITLQTKFHQEYTDNSKIILDYLAAHKEFSEQVYYAGKVEEDIPQETRSLLQFNLFSATWPIRIHQNLISKSNQLSLKQLYYLLAKISLLSNGEPSLYQRIEVPESQQEYLTELILHKNAVDNMHLLVLTALERNPILTRKQESISKFKYNQVMIVLGLLNPKEEIDYNFVKIKFGEALKDPSLVGNRYTAMSKYCHKFTNNYETHFFDYETCKNNKDTKIVPSCLPQGGVPFIFSDRQQVRYFYPFQFEEQFLSFEESSQFKFDDSLNRWVTIDVQELEERHQERQERAEQNKFALKKFADFSSAQKLVELLEKIPSLKLKLTEEERQVIGQPGNVVVIGRSGTGKTTCAVLRLFATEILFHLRVQMLIAKDAKILQDASTNQQIGLQSVFITASPVLANQIQKYYKKLTSQVKEEIRQKQLKKKQQEEEAKNKDGSSSEINKSKLSEAYSIISTLHGGGSAKEEDQENQNLENCLEEVSMIKKTEDTQDNNNNIEDEFEEENTNDRFIFSEDSEKGKSLKNLKPEDFPSFQTVRSYLMLIEACLERPFFPRDAQGQVVGQEGASSWSHYRSMTEKLQIKLPEENEDSEERKREDFYNEENLEEVYQREMYLLTHANADSEVDKAQEIDNPEDRKFEVDYDYFASAFWPLASAKFKDSNLISCTTLWTEIYSHIKGSSNSFSYSTKRMSSTDYLEKVELNALLSEEQRKIIYEMSEYYEKWKGKQSGYDLMDIVNYLLREIKNKRADLPSIHFTMIDEVQDLPYALITLFAMVNEQALFLAGDSAQTIARGVGFRFAEMKNSLKQMSEIFDKPMPEPAVKQLTINFRSHNKILQLSNSIISLIEGLFPSTIDVLKKERSNIDGFKPILLQDSDLNFLFTLLSGTQQENDPLKKGVPLEFGCNQVIIVKDEESKKMLPAVLQHAICLTIYESKGLEFDDVILFDFFANSKSSVQSWNSIELLGLTYERVSKETFIQMMTMHDTVFEDALRKNWEEEDFESVYGVKYNKETNEVTFSNVITKNNELKAFDKVSHSLLCSELKQLYTAVTRPKKRLIIFDSNTLKREKIENYWMKQQLVSIVSSNDMEGNQKQQEKGKGQGKKVEQAQSEENKKVIESMKQLLVKNTAEEWYEQGIKMFRFKYFEQAVKCFKKSGNLDHEKKAQAYFEAKTNSSEVMRLESELQLLRKKIGQYSLMKENIRIMTKQKLQNQLKERKAEFLSIGLKFQEIGRLKQAAQCLFSGGEFEKAGDIYLSLNLKKEAAESYVLVNDLGVKAAKLYEEAKEYAKAVESYDKVGENELILTLLHNFGNYFKQEQLDQMQQKYIIKGLQNILIKKEEKQQDEQQEIIQEKQEEDLEDSSSSFDLGDFSQDEVEEEEEKEAIKEEGTNEKTESFTVVETPVQSIDKKDNSSQQVFIADDQSDFSVIERECISVLGEEDWLKVEENQSIKDIISSKSIGEISFSEYSVLDNSFTASIIGGDLTILQESAASGHITSNQPKMIVHTGGQYIISDSQLLKALKLLVLADSQFVESSTAIINKNNQSENLASILLSAILNNSNQLLSNNLVDLVINKLNGYNQYKLSMLIANRFLSSTHLSTIIISLALANSPLASENSLVKPYLLTTKLSDPRFIKSISLSAIASSQMHEILESVEPELVTMPKLLSDRNILRGLLLLGYWKKLVFLTDISVGMPIAQCFGDYNVCQILLQQSQQQSLPSNKNNEEQTQILQMQQFFQNHVNKQNVQLPNLKDIPQSFTHNALLWSFISINNNINSNNNNNKVSYDDLEQILSDVRSIITNKTSNRKQHRIMSKVFIFDAISSFWILFRLTVDQLLQKYPFTKQQRSNIIQCAQLFSLHFNTLKFNTDIITPLLAVYSCQLIPHALQDIYGSQVVVYNRKSALNSNIFTKLLSNDNKLNQQQYQYFCDISLDSVIMQLNDILSAISSQLPNNLTELSKYTTADESQDKQITQFRQRNNNLIQATEIVKYKLLTKKDKLAAELNLKREKYDLELRCGLISKEFNNQFPKENEALKQLNKYVIIQLLANHNNKQVNQLIIPKQQASVVASLSCYQMSLLQKQNNNSDDESGNNKILTINLNMSDNSAELDKLTTILLNRTNQRNNSGEIESDDEDCKQVVQPDDECFLLVLSIQANAIKLLPQTVNNLNTLLKEITLTRSSQNLTQTNKIFYDLINSNDAKQKRELARLFISSNDFKNVFKPWESIRVQNEAKDKQNSLLFDQENSLIEKELLLRKKVGSKLVKLMKECRKQMIIRKELNIVIDDLSDILLITQLSMSSIQSWMVKNKNGLACLGQLKKVQQSALKFFYLSRQISSNIYCFILNVLDQKQQLLQSIAEQVKLLVVKGGNQQYLNELQEQAIKFAEETQEIISNKQQIELNNINANKKPKNIYLEKNQNASAQSQRVQQLLKKRANILKQKKVIELKQIRKMMSRK